MPRVQWKSGEQLEFLLSHEAGHKRHQDQQTLDRFWPRVFEQWYDRWPLVATPALIKKHKTRDAARMMMQNGRNKQIKTWFNNRRRMMESTKARGDLKLDVKDKKKLAPVQAYCSYAWASTLRPIVLARWEQQKATLTVADEDDPLADSGDPPEEACIPLSFKLEIAREIYDQLSQQEKDDIDVRREEDRQKIHRKITDIADDEERKEKLTLHLKNQALVQKSLVRILGNLEDHVGCIAHIFIGSIAPKSGRLNVQKFCGGKTKGGVDFETHYGDDWEDTVEKKFTEWATKVFGAQGSEERNKYLLPSDPDHSSQELAYEGNPPDELVLEAHSATQVPPPSNPPVPTPPISPALIGPIQGGETLDLPPTEPLDPSALEPSQPTTSSPQLVSEPSTLADHSQPALLSSPAPTEDATVNTRPESVATSTPPQPPKAAVAPKVPYRVRNSVGVMSRAHSRKDSIEGAPQAIGLPPFSESPDFFNDNEPEVIVDLREFIDVETFTSLESDGKTEVHVSSSREAAVSEFSTLSPSPRPQHSTIQKVADCSQPAPARVFPGVGDNYDDLPSWMIKRGQWDYLVSTAGGPLWENLLRVYMRQERRLEFTETGETFTTEGRPSKISEYFQYAHKPSRGDTVTVPSFGIDVVNWWNNIQPEWRRSGQDSPQDPSAWSYILSGGSKGLFLVLMCLSWWHRAHARFLEENTRRIETLAAGITPNLDVLSTHDPEWLRIVKDVAFVIEKAQDCDIPTRAVSTPSRRAKRRRDPQPNTPRKRRVVSPPPLKKTRSRA